MGRREPDYLDRLTPPPLPRLVVWLLRPLVWLWGRVSRIIGAVHDALTTPGWRLEQSGWLAAVINVIVAIFSRWIAAILAALLIWTARVMLVWLQLSPTWENAANMLVLALFVLISLPALWRLLRAPPDSDHRQLYTDLIAIYFFTLRYSVGVQDELQQSQSEDSPLLLLIPPLLLLRLRVNKGWKQLFRL